MAQRHSRQTDAGAAKARPLPSSIKDFIAIELFLPPNSSIFKTPTILSRHHEQAYTPNAFSFGPFHYGSQKVLEQTKRIKLKYLQSLLLRFPNPEQLYRQLVEAIRSKKGEVRRCYAGPIESCDEEELVEIMVLDGCFIIELFRKCADEVTKDPDDPTFSMSCLQEFLRHDLILLENQIPWLVLELLFDLTSTPPRSGKPLIQLALDYFSNIFSSDRPPVLDLSKYRNIEINHILDLLRHSLLIPLTEHHERKSNEKNSVWEPLPCARKIHESGIQFKKVSAHSILDIQFKNGVLEIPPLLVQETTETIFRNLISFEQCYPHCEPIVTSYAKFVDNLIETDEDVKILCNNYILDNWLDTEETQNHLKKLYNHAYVKKFYYGDICHRVNIHRERLYPRLRFLYMHYFTNPWAIVSQVVAAILLVLTFLQTLYAIIGQK